MNEKTKKILCIAGFLFIIFLIAKRQQNKEEKTDALYVPTGNRGGLGLITETVTFPWRSPSATAEQGLYERIKNDPRWQDPRWQDPLYY